MCIRSHPIRAVLFLMIALFALPAYAQEKTPDQKPAPVWKQNPTLAKKLGNVLAFNGFALRTPQLGETTSKVLPSRAGELKAYAWRGEPRREGTCPILIVAVFTPPSEAKILPSPEEFMEVYLNDPMSGHENWKRTDTEKGVVNGFTVARVYWSGTHKKSGYEMHGFVYIYTDGKIYYALTGQDLEPYNEQTLPLIETAVLSFNRKEAFSTKVSPKKRH